MLRKRLAVLLVIVLLVSSGCVPGQEKGDKAGAKTAEAAQFASYPEIKVQDKAVLKPYQVSSDLSNISNRERFEFSRDAQDMLVKNGFVVIPGMGYEFFMDYEINRYDMIPNFVTTDAVLHNYHLFYNHLLKNVETADLIPELKKLNNGMMQASSQQFKQLKGTAWENAARRNLAFFTVGSVLLDPGVKVPSAVQKEVKQELDLISEHSATQVSPVMSIGTQKDLLEGFKEDYTQYIPRGHYTDSDALKSYFKSMMWYGRMTFRLKDEDETRSAALMTMALRDAKNMDSWANIYSSTAFMVGKSDDLGYEQYNRLLEDVYGKKLSVKELGSNQELWKKFREKAQKLEPPVINSIPIFDASIQPDRNREILGYRFMGQRFTLDAAIFQRLVYREVGENENGERRMLPSGLDIPAAMGSNKAEEILKAEGAFGYQNYGKNLAKVQEHVAGLKNEWHQNLYWSWLYTLLPLTAEKPAGYPSFMLNDAWQAKELNTFLGSWTELKHDTILYAKQVYAEAGGGGEEEIDDRGYVEPNPHLYARLAALTAMTRDGLAERGMLEERDKENMNRLYEMAVSLKTISEKELADQTLSDEEYELIRSFGGQLEHFWLEALRDKGVEGRSELGDNPAMLVADVATNPPHEVLEVATGYIDSIYAVVPVDGKLRIAKGGVYSYYEFPWPATDRLSDKKWREKLADGSAPDLPKWTGAFRSKGTCQLHYPWE